MQRGNHDMPAPGDIIQNFRRELDHSGTNHLYQVLTVANHIDTGETLVILKKLFGGFNTYAIPIASFNAQADHNIYPDIKQKYVYSYYNFKYLGDAR